MRHGYPNPDAVVYPTTDPPTFPCQLTTRAVTKHYPIHDHGAWIDKTGNGNTDVDAGHFHRVRGFRVLPDESDGHIHDLTMLPCGAGAAQVTGRKGPLNMMGSDLGRMHPHRRRSWFSPTPSYDEAPAAAPPPCNTYGPRGDGLYVTICNGQVVSYHDAAGNTHNVGQDDSFMGAADPNIPTDANLDTRRQIAVQQIAQQSFFHNLMIGGVVLAGIGAIVGAFVLSRKG